LNFCFIAHKENEMKIAAIISIFQARPEEDKNNWRLATSTEK